MARIWTPDEAHANTFDVEANAEAARVMEFTKRLQAAFDQRYDCFLQTQDRGDLRAGFYYVRRRNDDGTVSTWEVSNPDGSFREPDEQVIDALRASDTWNRDVWREIERNRERIKRNQQAEIARMREERQAHLADALAHRFRVQVPVTPEGKGRLTNRRSGDWK